MVKAARVSPDYVCLFPAPLYHHISQHTQGRIAPTSNFTSSVSIVYVVNIFNCVHLSFICACPCQIFHIFEGKLKIVRQVQVSKYTPGLRPLTLATGDFRGDFSSRTPNISCGRLQGRFLGPYTNVSYGRLQGSGAISRAVHLMSLCGQLANKLIKIDLATFRAPPAAP